MLSMLPQALSARFGGPAAKDGVSKPKAPLLGKAILINRSMADL